MQNAYKFKNRVGDPDILLSPDTLLSPTKGGALSRAHGRPTIIPNTKTREGNLSRFILFCSIIIFRFESLLAPAGSGDAS